MIHAGLFLGDDVSGNDFTAPISSTDAWSDVVSHFANLLGGRWYLDNTGVRTLICTHSIAKLDYKINSLNTFGIPLYEKYDQPVAPFSAAVHNYQIETAYTDILDVPKFSGDALTVAIAHNGCADRKVYSRVGDVDTEITNAIVEMNTYNTVVRSDIWIASTDPPTTHTRLVIKGQKISDSVANNTSTVAGTNIDNPLVTTQYKANGVLSWSFPDFAGRSYRFTMRDDPSLKCGNIVQLAVDNEYLDVLLIEAKRTFNGAGRVEYRAVYIGITGDAPFPVAVTSPTVAIGSTSAVFAWNNLTGYDDWDNVDIEYLIYDTTTTPTLIATVPYPATTTTVAGASSSWSAFSVAVRVDNFEWPSVAFV